MGLLDRLKEKRAELEQQKKQQQEAPAGKYPDACALCGGTGTDKKWMGQHWHRKCLRAARKGARRML